jgi:hypothetical protein
LWGWGQGDPFFKYDSRCIEKYPMMQLRVAIIDWNRMMQILHIGSLYLASRWLTWLNLDLQVKYRLNDVLSRNVEPVKRINPNCKFEVQRYKTNAHLFFPLPNCYYEQCKERDWQIHFTA